MFRAGRWSMLEGLAKQDKVGLTRTHKITAPTCFSSCASIMFAALENVLAQIRAAGLMRDEHPVRASDTATTNPQVSLRRARPPERRSPSPIPRTQRRVSSPCRYPPGGDDGQWQDLGMLYPRRNPYTLNSDLHSSNVHNWREEYLPVSSYKNYKHVLDGGPPTAVTERTYMQTQRERECYVDSQGQRRFSSSAGTQPVGEFMATVAGPKQSGFSDSGTFTSTAHARDLTTTSDTERFRQEFASARKLDCRFTEVHSGLPAQVSESVIVPDLQDDYSESAAAVESAKDDGGRLDESVIVPDLQDDYSESAAAVESAKDDGGRLDDCRLDKCPIWIVGHSCVLHGERYEFECLQSPEAELIRWIIVRGLRWEQVMPLFWQQLQRSGCPLRVVFHAGGNDLTKRTGLDLRTTIIKDLVGLQNKLPFLSVGWSYIIPRLVWRDADRPGAIEVVRRRTNVAVGRAVSEKSGFVVQHPSILFSNPQIYMDDGEQLNLRGMEIFLEDLMASVFSWECRK
ncbi:uncharacterized protein LOC134948481 isoform X2 [Pseudophryne corroboree]|uniref:uncharacterized protein LOC134948481 isoform X2 n=1 Tax=Pseudophryne corroboree TaxID=495146 RepID=UPI0030814E97